MNRFLTVILGAALLPVAVRAGSGAKQVASAPDLCRGIFAGHDRRTHGIESDAVATSPGKLKGKLARENQNLRFDYNHTDYPIPCSPIPKMVAHTAVAVCASCLGPRKGQRTSTFGGRATCCAARHV